MWIRLPYALLQWGVSAAIKLPLFVIGLVAVFFSVLGDGWKRTPSMWQFWANAMETPGRYYTRWGVYYYWAIRNPVRGMVLRHPSTFQQSGGIDEAKDGFQWRYRWSGPYDSFRIVWGEPRAEKGKREFYIGWKLGSKSPFKFTVQLRPF